MWGASNFMAINAIISLSIRLAFASKLAFATICNNQKNPNNPKKTESYNEEVIYWGDSGTRCFGTCDKSVFLSVCPYRLIIIHSTTANHSVYLLVYALSKLLQASHLNINRVVICDRFNRGQ